MNLLKLVMANEDEVNLVIVDKDYVLGFIKKGIDEDKLKLVFVDQNKTSPEPAANEAYCVKCKWKGAVPDPMPQFCPNCRAYNALKPATGQDAPRQGCQNRAGIGTPV